MQKEAYAEVWPHCPQHLRHQLQLVIVHPNSRSRRGGFGHGSRVPVVDRHVGVPPLPVERRASNRVVVQRPQGGIGKPEVKLLELGIVEGHGTQLDPRVLRRHDHLNTTAWPTDPHNRPACQRRCQCRDQAAGAQIPMHLPVALHPPDRQPVSHHDQLRSARPTARLTATIHHRTLPRRNGRSTLIPVSSLCGGTIRISGLRSLACP